MAIVLDTWALLALLNDEPAAARVEEGMAGDDPVICSVNLGEALYLLIRSYGEEAASKIVERVRAEVRVIEPNWDLTVATAKIKANGGLSFADCFALATARRFGAQLWTGDPEILEIASGAEVVDLRSPHT